MGGMWQSFFDLPHLHQDLNLVGVQQNIIILVLIFYLLIVVCMSSVCNCDLCFSISLLLLLCCFLFLSMSPLIACFVTGVWLVTWLL